MLSVIYTILFAVYCGYTNAASWTKYRNGCCRRCRGVHHRRPSTARDSPMSILPSFFWWRVWLSLSPSAFLKEYGIIGNRCRKLSCAVYASTIQYRISTFIIIMIVIMIVSILVSLIFISLLRSRNYLATIPRIRLCYRITLIKCSRSLVFRNGTFL